MKVNWRTYPVLCLTAALLMQSPLSAGASEPQHVGPPVLDVPVFYATDREKLTSNKEEAGAKLAPFTMGCARVFLPYEKRWQNGDNLSEQYQKLGWQVDSARDTIKPFIEVRGYVAEPAPQSVLSVEGECSDFWSRLKAQAEASSDHRVYVYIHGFASSGNNAVYSAGILAAELEAPVIAFTWPSKGTAGLKPLRLVGRKRMRALYLADREMIDQPQVLADLSIFISKLKTELGPNVKVNLVAHSLGNRLLAKYLAGDATDDFAGVYFLAADIDQRLFMEALKKLQEKSSYTAIYTNKKDRALKASVANDLLGFKISRRLGDANFSVPGVEFIDYGLIAEPRSIEYLKLMHYVPFEHFGSIVRTGQPFDDGNGHYIVRRTTIERSRRK
ncbi:MAG: alpha/beta hydrolase [Candidatus Obscuribacter sp.]|nr:alpha/beta hydrolase [Candidatus Obscuribacter sp.]